MLFFLDYLGGGPFMGFGVTLLDFGLLVDLHFYSSGLGPDNSVAVRVFIERDFTNWEIVSFTKKEH